MASAAGDGGLRLLCLHGYQQSADSFRARTGALRKALRGHAQLFYVDAPHLVDARSPEGAASPDPPGVEPRGWWFSSAQEPRSFSAREAAPAAAAGLEESLAAVARALAERGPVDGLLGFSQGAALVSVLCALQQQGDPRFPFRFAVLFAGFAGVALPSRGPLRIPSLHVFGETDRVIPAEMSRELASRFLDPVIVRHPGGHYVPVSSAEKKAYLRFLLGFAKAAHESVGSCGARPLP